FLVFCRCPTSSLFPTRRSSDLGLCAALFIGKRIGYGKDAMPPYNLTLTLIGCAMLWIGWFGFNAGSALAADSRAGMALATTQIRSEEHTSELQSRFDLVCRLLL